MYKYPSGNRYEGEFRADQRHGRGLYLWRNTVRFMVIFDAQLACRSSQLCRTFKYCTAVSHETAWPCLVPLACTFSLFSRSPEGDREALL